MGRLLLRWILLAVSVIAASLVTEALGLGFKTDVAGAGDFIRLMLGVAILALLNATLGKILKLLTLPLNCLTLGLFSLVINAIVLMIAASFNMGYRLEGSGFDKFLAALVGSILISLINGILGTFLPDKEDE